MLFTELNPSNPLRDAITSAYRMDETECLTALLTKASLPLDATQRISATATKLVAETRKQRKKQGGLDTFLHEYDLSSEEGIALMCLAEALLRVPDVYTRNRLIADKISTVDWSIHASNSLFVNAATWSLLLTGKIFASTLNNKKKFRGCLKTCFKSNG